MDNKNIKKLVGSISIDNVITSMLNAADKKTIGDLYDANVSCSRCAFQNKCETLATYLEEQGKNPNCAQLVNILLGDSKLTDVE